MRTFLTSPGSVASKRTQRPCVACFALDGKWKPGFTVGPQISISLLILVLHTAGALGVTSGVVFILISNCERVAVVFSVLVILFLLLESDNNGNSIVQPQDVCFGKYNHAALLQAFRKLKGIA